MERLRAGDPTDIQATNFCVVSLHVQIKFGRRGSAGICSQTPHHIIFGFHIFCDVSHLLLSMKSKQRGHNFWRLREGLSIVNRFSLRKAARLSIARF